MRYHNITKRDMLNGEGVRVVLWLSHCEHNCEGCHNPQTHSKDSGIEFDESALGEILEELERDEVKGITFSGGDPLSHINRKEVLDLIGDLKALYPCKDVWLYTGYTWDAIKDLPRLRNVDVLVDGKFEKDLSVPSPKWCGSSNQRVIDVWESLLQGEVILHKSEFEN